MKLKRFLTTALSALMALSVCALPVMAEDATTGDPVPVWSQTGGTITIHKYEYNGDNKNHATGEDDANQLPTDKETKPLKDAEFTIYKVRDEEWLKGYYGGKAGDYTNVDDIDTYVEKDSTTGKYKLKTEFVSAENTKKVDTTNDNGIATFGNSTTPLPLGLYIVIETKTPDKVTTPCEPFLVSVPMTRVGTTLAQQDWLYDVHVYPKNSTTYGKVTIEKKGKIGNGEASALQYVVFGIQKWDGTEWKDFETNESTGKNYTEEELTTNASGQIVLEGLSQGKYRVYEKSFVANTDTAKKGCILDQTPYVFEVGADGKITYDGKEESNITIPVTNERPDLTKKVQENGGTNYGQEAQYGVGDTVPYQITVTVPSNIAKLKTFTVTDTPTNVKFNGLTSVTCDNVAVDSNAYKLDKTTPLNGFTLKFTPSAMGTYAGKTITISYTGTVLNSAVTTTVGNTNEAKLTYTNKIGIDGKPDDTSESYVEDHAAVYTFSIKVEKIAGDTKQGLDGVKFNLYTQRESGKAVPQGWSIADADELKLPKTDGYDWYQVNVDPLETTDGGYITVNGLANGDYYLVETLTKEGYNLLTEPFKVELKVQMQTTWSSEETYDGAGNVIKHKVTGKTTTFTGSDDATTAIKKVTVVNRKGFELPVTGGFGTLLFSGIGVLLVLGGVSVLFSLKKKNGRA